jgi:cytochrome c5
MDTVYKKGLEGTDAGMPAKGGSSLSDKEFKLVVDYIVDQSK